MYEMLEPLQIEGASQAVRRILANPLFPIFSVVGTFLRPFYRTWIIVNGRAV